MTIMDTTLNACKLEKGWIFGSALKPLFDSLKQKSNISFKCPVKKVSFTFNSILVINCVNIF
jgi:hypothetical protein